MFSREDKDKDKGVKFPLHRAALVSKLFWLSKGTVIVS